MVFNGVATVGAATAGTVMAVVAGVADDDDLKTEADEAFKSCGTAAKKFGIGVKVNFLKQ